MQFTKMHGLGNDFVVVENINGELGDLKDFAIKICDRNRGIGADGVLLVEKSLTEDIRMGIINSDGSTAEMCGNGVRCFSKYVYEKGIVNKNPIEIETLAGKITSNLKVENGKVSGIKVNMGKPIFEKDEIPFKGYADSLKYDLDVMNKKFKCSTLRVGVPHTIVFVDEINVDEIVNYGKVIEKLEYYPKYTNVNFVQVVDRNTIRIRTWERGAGLTFACGTGTCASVIAAFKNGLTENKVTAMLHYGNLDIEYDGEYVYMEGPAEFICSGEFFED